MIGLLSLVPAWGRILAIALIAAALFCAGFSKGAHHVRAQWDLANAQRLAADNAAILARIAENAKLAEQQRADNSTITKAKNEELAPIIARAHTDRVRVGTALCSGSAATAEAASPASGDTADPPGRLVREDVERDIITLKIDVETDMATGRACQAFLTKNGLVP